MACDNFLTFDQPAVGLNGNIQPIGESTDSVHPSALEIKEFSFGVENPTTIGSTSGGAGAGKAKFNEFTIKKGVDRASPALFLACGQGCHFPECTLTIRKAGGVKLDYLVYKYAMVYVTKVEWIGGGGEEAPEENVTFVYGALQIQYQMQDTTGAAVGTKAIMSWSQISNSQDFTVAPPAAADQNY